MINRVKIGFLLLSLFPLFVWADTGTQGEIVYRQHCITCHGMEGAGDGPMSKSLNPPPIDFTKPHNIVDLGKTRMVESITNGRSNTAMMPWADKLSAQEIEAVTDYIMTRLMQIHSDKNAVVLPDRLKRGEKIYQQNCSVCHGDYGETGVWTRKSMDTAPRNFTSEFAKNVLTRIRMIESVTRGRPGTAMMPYGSRLSQEQVESVVDYIRVAVMKFPLAQVEAERQGIKPEEQVIFDQKVFMAQPLPGNLMGSHKNGGRIFNKNCVPCHGKNGDGQGPRAYFINPKPRNFISNDSRLALNRPKIFKAVTNGFPGTVMPAWGKVFSEQDIADVAEYVFRAFIKADIEPSPVELGELKKKSKE